VKPRNESGFDPALDAGFFIFWGSGLAVLGFEKPEAELEGEFATSEPVSPTRQEKSKTSMY